MSGTATIWIDQGGGSRTIRYNLDLTTRQAAQLVEASLEAGALIEIPHEDGDEPIFVNPDYVTSITPGKES